MYRDDPGDYSLRHARDWYSGRSPEEQARLLSAAPTQARLMVSPSSEEQTVAEAWQPSVFERALFIVFAITGTVTFMATIYMYFSIYRALAKMAEAFQQLGGI